MSNFEGAQTPDSFVGRHKKEAVPYPELVDAAGVFDRTEIELEALRLLDEHATGEITAPVQQMERRDNARTLLMEALTASGHLSRIEISGSDVDEINRQVLARLLNGFYWSSHPRERERNFAELCNELIIQRVHRGIAAGDIDPNASVLEISDYISTDAETAANLGYRPSNKRGMVRSTHLRKNADGTYTRIIEQISRSNATGHDSEQLLAEYDTRLEPGFERDVAMLRCPQLYSTNEMIDGVVDVQRRLDEINGAGVLYGESAPNQLHVGYDEVRWASLEREDQIEFYIDSLAAYDERLDLLEKQGRITSEARNAIFRGRILETLRAICLTSPEYTRDCFGDDVVEVYAQASLMVAAGDYNAARYIIERYRHLEKPAIACGVKITSEEAERLGLDPSDAVDLAKEAKATWKWKPGKCVVRNCPSPKPCEVGPCKVCRRCQKIFDGGGDPSKPTLSEAGGDKASVGGLAKFVTSKETKLAEKEQAAAAADHDDPAFSAEVGELLKEKRLTAPDPNIAVGKLALAGV